MKKFSLILISLLTMTALFTTSCKKEIENVKPKQVHESASVKSVINSLRTGASQSANAVQSGNDTQSQITYAIDNFLCFDFVYPISVIYNDGTIQSLADDNEFAQAIANQSNQNYIIDYVYPFDITQNGTVTTINNEDDFSDAVDSCFTLVDFTLSQMSCFDFVYPVSVKMSDGSIVVANNQQEFEALFMRMSMIGPVDMVYPLDIIQDGETITIENMIDFQEALFSCNRGYGNLPFDLDTYEIELVYPVTLIYNDGTTLQVNDYAEYEDAVWGSTATHYIIDFQYDIDVIDHNGATVTIHNLNELYDLIDAYILDLTGGGGNSGGYLPSTSDFPCFNINYPVTIIYSDGSTLSVSSDAEYDQNLTGAQNIVAVDLQYPITITQNGSVITINNRTDFDNYVSGCN